MSIVINILYRGENGAARRFAEEMTGSGTVAAIRAEDGNEGYAYYFPMEDPEAVLLIDRWRDQKAIDAHHATPMMARITALREKYGLHMQVQRFVTDEAGIPEGDQRFIRR